MANELQLTHTTGQNVYAILRNAAGQVWNGAAFVTQDNANWGDYDLPLTETPASGGFYLANLPALAAGVYSVVAYQRAGQAPAVTDDRIAVGELAWSGTALLQPAEIAIRLASIMEQVPS
jgi:hypothetical protein